jgi:hypothetical protein
MESRDKKLGEEGTAKTGLTWSRRLSWLNRLLWGGTILLALEHVWHGEIVAWPPFLTAMRSPGDIAPMLHEMATVGVAMAIAVTAVWAISVMIVEIKTKAMPEVKANPINRGE